MRSDFGRVEREDLERGIRAVEAEIRGTVESRRSSLIVVGSAISAGLLLLAWLLGRRSGRRSRGVIEIRR